MLSFFAFLKRKVKPKNFFIKGGNSVFVTVYPFLKSLLMSAGHKAPPCNVDMRVESKMPCAINYLLQWQSYALYLSYAFSSKTKESAVLKT